MIDFKTIKPGGKVRVVGAGAPGFAALGDILEITDTNNTNRVSTKREDGEKCDFVLTCGAARLELIPE